MIIAANKHRIDYKKRDRLNPRAGSIYIVAMGTSLVVVCLAVASLQAVRVQRRINDELSQTANAKKLAQSGIDFAQHRILTDPSWRTFLLMELRSHGPPRAVVSP